MIQANHFTVKSEFLINRTPLLSSTHNEFTFFSFSLFSRKLYEVVNKLSRYIFLDRAQICSKQIECLRSYNRVYSRGSYKICQHFMFDYNDLIGRTSINQDPMGSKHNLRVVVRECIGET